jgi:hypothetical protein
MKEEIKAYAAGIFDGEGSLDIYNATPAKASKSPSFMLRVVISQKDGKVMDWFKQHFGGYVGLDKHGGYYIYRWDIRSQKAKQFLLLILPYVLIKKAQVELALKFEQHKEQYLLSLKGHQGFRKLSQEEIDLRLQMKEDLSKLKKVYSPYTQDSAATTTKRKNLL